MDRSGRDTERRRAGGDRLNRTNRSFLAEFTTLFDAEFPRLYRYLDRLSGDPDLAADLAQETFVRLYGRGRLPETPRSWLVAVGMNLFRNSRNTDARRDRLLAGRPEEARPADLDSGTDPLEGDDRRARVRAALHRLPERERKILLLRVEGYRYREIAEMVGLAESGIGTVLARARAAFRTAYEDDDDAS